MTASIPELDDAERRLDAFHAEWIRQERERAVLADVAQLSGRVVAFVYGALAMLALVSAAQWIGGNSDWALAGWGALLGIAGIWITTKERT